VDKARVSLFNDAEWRDDDDDDDDGRDVTGS
jgi:hypothetical protein